MLPHTSTLTTPLLNLSCQLWQMDYKSLSLPIDSLTLPEELLAFLMHGSINSSQNVQIWIVQNKALIWSLLATSQSLAGRKSSPSSSSHLSCMWILPISSWALPQTPPCPWTQLMYQLLLLTTFLLLSPTGWTVDLSFLESHSPRWTSSLGPFPPFLISMTPTHTNMKVVKLTTHFPIPHGVQALCRCSSDESSFDLFCRISKVSEEFWPDHFLLWNASFQKLHYGAITRKFILQNATGSSVVLKHICFFHGSHQWW